MIHKLTITKEKPSEHCLDYEYLRKEGLEHIENLARMLWTDYNVHDPGIATMELLCYAITDLGFRISCPIEDILAGREGSAARVRDQFLTAMEILPSKPVTINDYRKLLIDIDGIKNAWLKEARTVPYYVNCQGNSLGFSRPAQGIPSKPVHVRGLYDVTLELEEDRTQDKNKLISEARRILLENRILCEDFERFSVVQQEEFILCAEIDLDHEADIEFIQARVFHEIQKYLTPSVGFYSLREMLNKGKTPDRIFDGPVLQNGFIDDKELESSSLTEEIRLSDIINIIMDINGVVAVRDILVSPYKESGKPEEIEGKWSLRVKDGRQPVLKSEKCRIVFYKDMIPLRADMDKSIEFKMKMRKDERLTKSQEDLPVPEGSHRNLQEYYSIQNHYPDNYGINETGLPESASETRKAQAKQLKAYLLFFDQVLANYFSQLAHVRELFSLDKEIKRTYFTQVVDSVKDVHEIYMDLAGLPERIQNRTEDEASFLQRRNRFLNHLLARFAESFNEYVWLMFSVYRNMDRKFILRNVINAKIDFLGDYEDISSRRGQAYDYMDSRNVWDTDNVSGLERRVARLLGMRNFKKRNLYDIPLGALTYDISEKTKADNTKEYRFSVYDGEAREKVLLSSPGGSPSKNDSLNEMKKALRRASTRDGYRLKETETGRFYFSITDSKGEVLARRNEYFETSENREDAIEHLIDFLSERYNDEGMFVVEHILLRPKKKTDEFLPLCPEQGCVSGEESDPYSFRLSIVLPAWSNRFSNMEFRRFVEKTLRLETPAHIMPRICWVNRDQMGKFETRYRKWLEYLSSGRTGEGKQLKEFVGILTALHSIYPEATLFDCTEKTSGKNVFILDRTNLGTKEE